MTNYYIVGPSGPSYVTALGGHSSLHGLLVGATPFAAMFSALIYSLWTNKSFRYPLLFSGCMLLSGNLLYAVALEFDCIYFLFAGRFMIGLGGTRGISRRYIADTVLEEERTRILSYFVACGALGMAAGPAIAVFLHHYANAIVEIPWFMVDRKNITFIFNSLTAPGYVMFVAWVFYTCGIMLFFREKRRNFHKVQLKDAESGTTEYSAIIRKTEIGGAERYEYNTINVHERKEAPPISPTKLHQLKNEITSTIVLYLVLLWINKFIVEEFISSGPIITRDRFGWGVHKIGTLGAIIGLLVVPISIVVGWLSKKVDDRRLILALFCIAVFGLVIFTCDPGEFRYVFGYLVVFASLQASESVITSSLSKCVSAKLAAGTFNSGLLCTEFGTAGRVTANGFLTMAGLLTKTTPNLLIYVVFTPACVLAVTGVMLMKFNWQEMVRR